MDLFECTVVPGPGTGSHDAEKNAPRENKESESREKLSSLDLGYL